MSECELGEVQLTSRGFQYVEFSDDRENRYSLQQSSAIGEYEDSYNRPGTSYVWLGVARDDGKRRMHLNREQVAALVETLGRWLERGTFICDDGIDSHETGGA